MSTDLQAPDLTADDEPAKVQVVRYQCPYCPYRRSSKALVRTHVARCWHRPANRSCRTCVHRIHQWGCPPTHDYPGHPEVEECAVGLDLPEHPTDPDRVVPAIGCPQWTPNADAMGGAA